jgi:hypothetical protein
VTNILSGATYVGINHYVDESQRSAWEAYAALDPSNYLSESYEYFRQLGIYYTEQNRTVPIYVIAANGTTTDDDGPGPYLVRRYTVFLHYLQRPD